MNTHAFSRWCIVNRKRGQLLRISAWWIAQSRSFVVKCRAGVNLTNRQLTLDATRWCCRSFSKTWLAMGKHAPPHSKMPARQLSRNMTSERDSWLLGVAALLFCCTSWNSFFRSRRVSGITLKSLPMCSLTLAPFRYTQNGILHMLDRNKRIKSKPERFQNCKDRFDLVITCEERVYDQVLEGEASWGSCSMFSSHISTSQSCLSFCPFLLYISLFVLRSEF